MPRDAQEAEAVSRPEAGSSSAQEAGKAGAERGEGGEVEVEVLGLAASGYLLARELTPSQGMGGEGQGRDGRLVELHPNGNSLDFFAGLVRRKLAT